MVNQSNSEFLSFQLVDSSSKSKVFQYPSHLIFTFFVSSEKPPKKGSPAQKLPSQTPTVVQPLTPKLDIKKTLRCYHIHHSFRLLSHQFLTP